MWRVSDHYFYDILSEVQGEETPLILINTVGWDSGDGIVITSDLEFTWHDKKEDLARFSLVNRRVFQSSNLDVF